MNASNVAVQAMMRKCMEQVEAGWTTPDNSIDSLEMRDQLGRNAAVFFADKLMTVPGSTRFADLIIEAPLFADPHLQPPLFADPHLQPPLFADPHLQPPLFADPHLQVSLCADKLMSAEF